MISYNCFCPLGCGPWTYTARIASLLCCAHRTKVATCLCQIISALILGAPFLDWILALLVPARCQMIRPSAYQIFQRILRAEKLPSAYSGQRLFGSCLCKHPESIFQFWWWRWRLSLLQLRLLLSRCRCSEQPLPPCWVYHPGAVTIAPDVVGVVRGVQWPQLSPYSCLVWWGVSCGPLSPVVFIAVAPVPPGITSVVPTA